MGRGDWSGRRPGQLRTWSPGRSCPPAARPHCDLVRPPCPQHRHRPAHENRLAPRGDSGTPCRVPTPTATPILHRPRGPRVSEKPSPCGARGATPAESSGCWPGGDAARAGPPTCAGQLLRGGCQLLQTCRGDVIAVRVQRRKLLAPSEHSICEKRRQRGRGSDFPFSERRTTLLTPLQRAPRALCGGCGTGLQEAAGPRGAAESANARLEEGAGAQRGLVFQSAPVPSSPRACHPHARQFPGRGFHVFDAKRCFCRPSGRGIGDVRAGLLEEAEHPGSTNTDLGAARAAGASPTRAPRGSPGTPAGAARRGAPRPRAPRRGRSPRSPPFVCSDRPGSSTPFQTFRLI